MDFFTVVESRRSVRRYTAKEVPSEVIEKALDAAVRAPNSSNLQTWEFYWVQSVEKKEALRQACLFQGTARTANHLIVAVSRLDTWKRSRDLLIQSMEKSGSIPKPVRDYYYKIIPFLYTQDPFGLLSAIRWLVLNIGGLFRPIFRKPVTRKDLFQVSTKSTALACENFMLAIVAQGFACCPMEGFDECKVKKILDLNRHASVTMIISVGEADSSGVFGPQFRVDKFLVIKKI